MTTNDNSEPNPNPNPVKKEPYEIDTTTQAYLRQCVKEGFEILAKEEKSTVATKAKRKPKSDPGEVLKKKLTADTSNPYEAARIKVLLDLSSMAKAEIVEMEASGNKDHYRYKEFIRMIIEEAEKNS
jgi:hypothetical protein